MFERYQRVEFRQVGVGGEIRRRLDAAAEHLLQIDVENEFVRHFKRRGNPPDLFGGFAGYGMLLDAVVKAVASGIGGERLAEWKRARIAELIGTQSSDGAISIFSDRPGVWDNHEQAYIIQALVNDFRLHGTTDALAAAVRLGDYMIAANRGLNIGVETAFLLLYQYSGESRFLDHCRGKLIIEQGIPDYDRALPVNGVRHVYTWLARSLAQLQYAELTGSDRSELHDGAEEAFRRILTEGCASITGSCTGGRVWGELWDRSQIGIGKWGETCASAYLMRLAGMMLTLTGNTLFGDLMERVMFNSFFGAQAPDGAGRHYFVPFNERPAVFEHETYCCPNNFRRMLFEIPENIWFLEEQGVLVNLYTPSTLTGEISGVSVFIEQITSYPDSPEVKLRISPAAPVRFDLALRIPRWCRGASSCCAGQVRTGAPGSCLVWSREWRSGDEVVLELPAPYRLVAGHGAQRGRAALMRGALVFGVGAAENDLTSTIDALSFVPESVITDSIHGPVVTMHNGRMGQPLQSIRFCRFSDEKRDQTYFEVNGPVNTEPDELFEPRSGSNE